MCKHILYVKYVLQMEKKSKTIKECCEGYKMLTTHDDIETDARCLPFCEKCLMGVCIGPNKCQCNPGYHGDDCAHRESKLISVH